MSLFDIFRRKHSKTAVISNSSNVTVNQIENFTQKEEATIEWVGLTLFSDSEKDASYLLDEAENEVVIKPLFTLQSKSDWPGKYKLNFPLMLDFTFNNSGDKPAVLNSVELEILDARIDNQAAYEARPEVNEAGYLFLHLKNYGWGGNKIENIELLSDSAKKYWNIDFEAFKTINHIDGHLTIVLKPELADKLEVIAESERDQLLNYQKQPGFWTPNPLFGRHLDETAELKQFLSLRSELITKNKILNSEIFSGRLSYLENGSLKEYKLNWGFVSHAATSFDLIKSSNGFELVRYQHPLAYLPPSMEYQARISVNDRGKTLTVRTSQSIEGGRSDRFLLTIHPEECLFADVSIKVNFNMNRQIAYPKILKLNLLEYKDNGDYQKSHQPVKTLEYEYSSEGRLIEISNKSL